VLQAAVDYVGRRGGGTVRIPAGTYRLHPSFSSRRCALSARARRGVVRTVATTRLIVDGDHWHQGSRWMTQTLPVGTPCAGEQGSDAAGTNIIQRTLMPQPGTASN
jgi:hypothetical protein